MNTNVLIVILNSHEFKQIDYKLWLRSYIKEISYYTEYLQTRIIKTIFFGGGTPSLMPPWLVEGIIQYLKDNFKIDDNLEITLEMNPASNNNIVDFRNAGINRLSLGVQSFNEQRLVFLDRIHNAQQATKSINIISNYFDNYSIDLIYATPNQTLKDWKQELNMVLDYIGKHVSLYQLTIEKGTKFFTQVKNKIFNELDEDTALSLYRFTQEFLAQHGYNRYEISNFALPNYECKHNLIYWQSKEYLGIGPGAHSRVILENNKYAMNNIYSPNAWIAEVSKNNVGLQKKELLSPAEIFNELIIMGLRLQQGIDITILNHDMNLMMTELLASKKYLLLQQQGFITFEQNRIRLSPKGVEVANTIISSLLYHKSFMCS